MSYGQQNYRGNTIYDNLGNNQNKNNPYNQANQPSSLSRKNQAAFNSNQNNNNNTNNSNKNLANLKYPDLDIQPHFNDGANTNVILQENMELDSLMKEYQKVFQDVDKMINQFSGGTDNTYKLNNIKKDLHDLDEYSASEHEKFLSELIEISKDNNIYDYDYKKYKNNSKNYDDKIIKVISDNKYEVILSTNKNNSQENKDRLNNYIKSKKEKNNKSNNKNSEKKYENPNSYDPPINNYNNYENQNKSSSSSSGQLYNFGNNIYGNNQNNNQDNSQRYPSYGFGNSIYSNQNNSNSNKKYENPNEFGKGDIYGNDNNYRGKNIYGINYNQNQYESQNYGGKISVRFTYQNNNTTREYNSNDKADVLYYSALELKDDPKLYNRRGRMFVYETLKDLRVIDVFEGAEPALNIY